MGTFVRRGFAPFAWEGEYDRADAHAQGSTSDEKHRGSVGGPEDREKEDHKAHEYGTPPSVPKTLQTT